MHSLVKQGYALSQQGKYDAAIHAFNETIKLNSQDAYAWHLKGDALDKQGKHDDAMQAYNEAIKLDPKNAYTWNNKGYSLSEKENTMRPSRHMLRPSD